MSARWLRGGAALLALTAVSATAAAQETPPVALNRFNPAPAGDRMFGVASPDAASPNQDGGPGVNLMILGDYAHNPLVLRRESSGENVGGIVEHQLFLHLNGAFVAWERLNVNIDVPFALYQGGSSPAADGLAFTSPSGATIGDLRFGARLRLFGDYFDPFQLAIGGYVWVPTGSSDPGSYVGEGTVRGMPMIIAGGRFTSVVWSANVGTDIRPGQTFAGVQQGISLIGGAGIGFLLDDAKRFQLGPEVTVSTVLQGEGPSKRNTNLEALLGARYRFGGLIEAGLGVGPGLTSGIGTPDVRAVASIAFAPEVQKPTEDRDKDGIKDPQDACPDVFGVADADPAKNGCPPAPPDRDKDGILDSVDACPDEPGLDNPDPKKHGCPPPGDKDKDGITDDVDACVDVPGVPSSDPKLNGCPPPDKDGDGVPDAEDACVDIPGLKTSDPATNGCPGDRDGDTIRDDKDACPDEKGKPNPDPTKNGCPTAVRVTEKEIIILQQVQFDTGRATIKKVSDELLDEVAGVLKEHPEIILVEVQGHTDIRGGRAFNVKLSQNRADSVKKALEKRGVEAIRLNAKGYGPDVPIGDNATDEGRQQNRRVQFKIIEKKSKSGDVHTAVPATTPVTVPAPTGTQGQTAPTTGPTPAPAQPAPTTAPAPAPKGQPSPPGLLPQK
ncbi:OmpA family protein [Chondromyces apiculatus]|nr:OmpA family protein [Chondromyces apiculatus]